MTTETESAVALLKADGWIVCPPLQPTLPIPEPEHGQLWVAPGPRVSPRFITERKALWVVDYTVPGSGSVRGQSREGFMAWARRSGARPILLEVRPADVSVAESPKIVLPFWKRLFGVRQGR